MNAAIGFDVYGTLVDPLEMNRHLQPRFGNLADRLAALWREKQLEYSFRRGLMGRYEDFGTCTRQALEFALRSLGLELSEQEREQLLEQYQNLKPFPDVLPGIQALRTAGYRLAAFSNGVEATVRTLLERAGVLPLLNGVFSVDDLKTFKPDPRVYTYLAQRLGTPPDATWLVSSNGWDVIGANSAGLRGAWIKRKPDAVFDTWGLEPDLVVADLEALAQYFVRA
jgi:2-haloacid dehalogenase